MKCILPFSALGLCLFISTSPLSAQNGLPPANPAAFPAGLKGNTGLQAVHYFTGWRVRGVAFELANKYWNSSLFGNMATSGLFAGSYNTATGVNALNSTTTGSFNTAGGYEVLNATTTGAYNAAGGYLALYVNTSGSWNTAFGAQTLSFNTTGYYNTAIGSYALKLMKTGSNNTGVGYAALGSASGSDLTAVGCEIIG